MPVVILTTFTLIAFAANSLLCRLALGGHLIDPVSFTTLRLVGGALALMFISRWVGKTEPSAKRNGSWTSGFALFVYAICFSLAYLSLKAGMGALILFGSVQITMIATALVRGEKPGLLQWTGTAVAIGGFIYLILPGISAPDPLGALLMCASGIAWGIYSIRGRGGTAPVAMTTGNFIRSAPLAVAASAIALRGMHVETSGIILAVISGVITSGLGYVLWYRVLRDLTLTQSALVQLLVPVLAAFGGVALLSEEVSGRLVIASVLILGGVALGVRNSPRSGGATGRLLTK